MHTRPPRLQQPNRSTSHDKRRTAKQPDGIPGKTCTTNRSAHQPGVEAMTEVAYTLEQAETDLRQVYWLIRASRETNWAHQNKARWIKSAMRRMGISDTEIRNATYCLKTKDCKRCNWNSDSLGIPCWAISKRRLKMLPNKEKRRI